MTLDILILTMRTREEYMQRLMACLGPQLARNPSVSLRIGVCDPAYSLGENRETLRRSAKGDYIAFVDDDDLLASDYIETILPLLDGVDYIGFVVHCYIDGKPLDKPTQHSLSYGCWEERSYFYARDISHINPIRRDLALLEPMEGGHGEDKRWADRMRARGVLKTEHYIPRVMYQYLFRSRKNIGRKCPKCGSASTVLVETGTCCNACGSLFDENAVPRKSCLWA